MSEFTVAVEDRALRANLRGYPARAMDKLHAAMTKIGLQLQSYIKTEKLSGQMLNVRSGTLRRSINREVYNVSSTEVRLIVGTNVKYAAYQEFGAHIPAVTGKLMVFTPGSVPKAYKTATGRLQARYAKRRDLMVFTMKHKAFDLRPRPFMQSSLAENFRTYEEEIRLSAGEAL